MQPARLRIRDIVWFQIGNADAIRRVVASRWSLVIGALLVFTAAIARNFDQTFLPWHGEKFAGPYIVPVISSFLVFIAIWWSGTRKRDKEEQPGFFRQYPGFLGAFLMTAPLAWFYAIPVEAMTDDLLTAAKWNVVFLSLVSLWRVWLITRVAQIVTGTPFFILLIAVLIPASAEAFFISIVADVNLVGLMGGILPPDKAFMSRALEVVTISSGICFGVTLVLSLAIDIAIVRRGELRGWKRNFTGNWDNPPKQVMLMTLAAALFSAIIAIPSQLRIWNRIELAYRVGNNDFVGALEFLRSKERSDFPPRSAFYRDPRRAYMQRLTQMINQFGPNDPEWVVSEYLETAKAVILQDLGMIKASYSEETSNLIKAVAKVPGGPAVLQISAEKIMSGSRNHGSSMHPGDQEDFLNDLKENGVEIRKEWWPNPPVQPEEDDTGATPAN